jgi:hypothetical protein
MITTRKLVALAAAASCVAAVFGLVASSPSQGDASRSGASGKARCPAAEVPPLYGTVDQALAAARRLLIRGSITAQGKTTKLTPKNSPVIDIVILARTARPLPGAAALRAAATRRCGSDVAQASWAVYIDYPELLISSSIRLAFLVRTKAGWRTY